MKLKNSLCNMFFQEKKITPENWHEDFIIHLAQVMKPNIYLELGLYQCKLFNSIIPFSNKLIGIDLDSKVKKYMKKSKKTEFFCMSTDKYFEKLLENPIEIDMLFIDANHSKESVMKDFENYFPFVKDQGLILLHDGYPKNSTYVDSKYCGDGYKAIEKLSQKTEAYEMMTLPMHPGLTLCRKRKKHLSW